MNNISDNFINKIIAKKTRIYVFYLLVIISAINVVYYTIKIPYLHRTINIFVLLLLLYFFLVRLYLLRLKFSRDEILVFILTLFSLLSAFLNLNFHKMNFIVPIAFCSMYLGISSFLKTSKVDVTLIKTIMNIFLLLTLVHLLIAFTGLLLPKDFPFFSKWVNQWSNSQSIFITGLYRNPNHFSNGLMVGVACSFTYIILNFIEKKKVFSKYYILLIIFLFGIVLTASRAVLLGIIIYIVLTVYYMIFVKKFTILNKKILITILLSLIAFIILLELTNSFEGLLIKKFNDSSRIYGWSHFLKYQFNIFPDIKLFFGRGFKGVINPNEASRVWKYSLHSIFLSTWAKYGLTGLTTLVLLLIELFKKNFRTRKYWYLLFIPVAFIFRDNFDEKWLSIPLWIESLFITVMFLIPYNIELNNGNGQ